MSCITGLVTILSTLSCRILLEIRRWLWNDSLLTTDHPSPCKEPDPNSGSEIEGSFLRLHKLMPLKKGIQSTSGVCHSGAYMLSNLNVVGTFGREVSESICRLFPFPPPMAIRWHSTLLARSLRLGWHIICFRSTHCGHGQQFWGTAGRLPDYLR